MSQVDEGGNAGNRASAAPLLDDGETSSIEAIESVVVRVLRIGVYTSVVLILLGVALTAIQLRGELMDPARLSDFAGNRAPRPRTLPELGAGLVALAPESIVALGILVLIATPIVRVLASMIAFIRLRDRTFAIVTAAVLLALLVSFALGRAG